MAISQQSPNRYLILVPNPPPSFTIKVPFQFVSIHPHLTSPFLSAAVVHALSAAGMLNAHFTHFAQRFAYLRVNCCECSRCSRKMREGRRKRETDGRWKKRDCFSYMTIPVDLNYRHAPTLHAP
ncbi:hypothetical protein CRENBAI_007350 [Crenichthys baileyi]|uniref:Uncharacterized protein n=1 Tax=Crenichthys baileyi TaxID=28760 RepID=A0AAV9R9L5_9TELE